MAFLNPLTRPLVRRAIIAPPSGAASPSPLAIHPTQASQPIAPAIVTPVSIGSNRVTQAGASLAVMNNTDAHPFVAAVPAGQSYFITAQGVGFYFVQLDNPGVNVRAYSGGASRSFIPYFQGTGLRLGSGYFERLELQNTGATACKFTLVILGGAAQTNGVDEYIDKRVIIQASNANVPIANAITFPVAFATRIPAWADSLAANTTQQVTDLYLTKNRKTIIFANDDVAAVLQVWDAAGNIIGDIQPLTSWTTDTGGTIQLRNPTANPVTCHIGEIYYS